MFSAEDAAEIRRAHRLWSTDQDLYSAWYAAPRAEIAAVAPRTPPLAGLLRASQESSWSSGCVVTMTGLADSIVVRTPAGATRAVSRGDYWSPARPGMPARVGDVVVTIDRAGGYESEGWWRAWSVGWDMTTTQPDVTRVYLSVRPDRVLDLPARLPSALDGAGLGWALKVAAVPAMLARPDCAVLYVHDHDREQAFGLVAATVTDLVDPAVRIPFTRVIVPGVAWSQDPGDGTSFGEHRCGVLAAAFAAAPLADPVVAVEAGFLAAGLDPAHPHLRCGEDPS